MCVLYHFFCYICTQIMCYMKDIKVLNENDISLVDKTNYLYADKNDIIYLRTTDYYPISMYYANILGMIFDLGKEDIVVMKLILEHPNITKRNIRELYIREANKSNMTFERAIKELTNKRIICVDVEDNIIINSNYKLINNINYSKYIVIDVTAATNRYTSPVEGWM